MLVFGKPMEARIGSGIVKDPEDREESSRRKIDRGLDQSPASDPEDDHPIDT